MIFSLRKAADGERDYAPWCVIVDGIELLNGIETETEALAIIETLRACPPLPAKVVPIRPAGLLAGLKHSRIRSAS
jgi:hypothetical protein